jgi:hypothetical protein
MIGLYRVEQLTAKQVKGMLVKADGEDVRFAISFMIDTSVYNQILTHIANQYIIIEVVDGRIKRVEPFKDEGNPFYVVMAKPDMIIKAVLVNEMPKAKFYEEYSKQANCTYRTAERHLKRAIDDGLVEEKDYYTIKLKTDKPTKATGET